MKLGAPSSRPLNLGLLGYGKMGQMIEELAISRGHSIAFIKKHKEDLLDFKSCDILIDFSAADCVLSHVEEAGKAEKNIIIGTTGWDSKIPQVKALVEKYQIGVLYSPNFSIGVLLFLKLVREAALLFSEYDIAGLEIHHKEKKDAPSGTAIALKACIEKARNDSILEFTSVRLGQTPGTHTVYFDSNEDTITMTHTAKGRAGFVLGALTAAVWLNNKKGFFTLEDIL